MNRQKSITASFLKRHRSFKQLQTATLVLCLLAVFLSLGSCDRTKIEYVNKGFHSSTPIASIAVFPIIQIAEKDNWCILPTWLAGVDNRRTTSGPTQEIIKEAHAMMMQNLAKLYKNQMFITPDVVDSILSLSPEKRTTLEAMNVLRNKIHVDAFVILQLNAYRKYDFNRSGNVHCRVGSDDVNLSLFDNNAVVQWTIKADCMLDCGAVKTYPDYIDYLFGRQLDWQIAEVNESAK